MDVSIPDLKKFIKSILKNADLSKLSSKMIRRKCEEKFQTELSQHKQLIDKLIMAYIEYMEAEKNSPSAQSGSSSSDDNSESEAEDSKPEISIKTERQKTNKNLSAEDSKPEVVIKTERQQSNKNFSSVPVKKRKLPEAKETILKKANVSHNSEASVKQSSPVKKKESEATDDATIARQLQDEEWNFRHRAVKKLPKKRNTKTKSDGKPKVRKGNSAYNRKCFLSEELSAMMNQTEMARPDVVKRIWEIARERNLFDPKNKQFILCDEQLQKMTGRKRVRMFGIMKSLKNHIKPLE